MATNLKDKTIICYDNGLFADFCLKLADYYGQVYYYTPWKDAFPSMAKMMVGTEWLNGKRLDTFEGKNFMSIDNFFDYLPKAHIAFFADVGDGDLQEYILENTDIPVFGSRKGEELELERWDTKQYFKKIGMDVQPIKRFIGIDALKEHLKKVENKWIKISKFRGNFETFHHIKYSLTEPRLQQIEWKMGPMARVVEFLVEDNIEAKVEDGIDAYCIDGKFPNYAFAGVEVKEESFAGKFRMYSELGEGIKVVNKQMTPALKAYGYRGFISSEVREGTDGKHYAIDPCTRLASPPSEIYQELYKNLGEIIWEGANGNIIDPIPTAKYGIEVMIHSEWFNDNHQAIFFPPEIRKFVKLRSFMKIDGQYYTLNGGYSPGIGALIAIGDTIEECKKKIIEMAPKIEGYGVTINLAKVDEAIIELNKTLNPEK